MIYSLSNEVFYVDVWKRSFGEHDSTNHRFKLLTYVTLCVFKRCVEDLTIKSIDPISLPKITCKDEIQLFGGDPLFDIFDCRVRPDEKSCSALCQSLDGRASWPSRKQAGIAGRNFSK